MRMGSPLSAMARAAVSNTSYPFSGRRLATVMKRSSSCPTPSSDRTRSLSSARRAIRESDRDRSTPCTTVVARRCNAAGRASYEALDTVTSCSPRAIESRSSARFTNRARSHKLCSVYTIPGRAAGQGVDDQLSECGRVGEMEVHHVVVPLDQHVPEGRQPPQIGVVGGVESVNGRPTRDDRRHQGVLVPEHVGHLVLEALPVRRRDHVDEQPFCAAVTETFDREQHP